MKTISRSVGPLLLLGLIVVGAVGAPQQAAAGYSALMMDLRSGNVIEERNADRRRQPASLTKMMTLYLAFEAVETGQIGLDTRVRVSRKAARQPASKLYLKAGERVSIRHLIRATAIKSANDAALVLAEAIGGSQAGFARMMTDKARALGMTRTTFRNPHGLTQKGHLSTARDMARLARAVRYHFPQYFNVFGRSQAHAAGRRITSTNRLLRSYSGATGMKTGYTSAAGYNLVATAKRGPREVLSVVMGGRSSVWRWRKSARLLDEALRKAPRHARVRLPRQPGIALAAAPLPAARPQTRATGFGAVAAVVAPEASAATRGAGLPAFAPVSARAPRRTSPPVMRDRGDDLSAGTARRIARLPAAPGSTVPLPDQRPGWTAQFGAFRERSRAVAHLNALALADLPALSEGRMVIDRDRTRSGRRIYKVRSIGHDERGARGACKTLRAHGRDCLVIAP